MTLGTENGTNAASGARNFFDGPPFSALRSIAVLRALQLGDMLCVIPALRMLRAAAPHARITLIGLPWAESFARRFDRYIDDYIAFPGFPGLPEQAPVLEAFPDFISAAQQRRFDLVLQMHGSGTLTNPLAALFGAAHNAGFYQSGQYCPDRQRFLLWDEHEQEILRYVRLMRFLGAAAQGTQLEFPVSDSDYRSLRSCSDRLPAPGTYACIHPGARLPSRRWPRRRFAEIADRLASSGLHVVLTGATQEADITAEVLRNMRMPALDLAGKTDLGALAALVAGARLVVCNDTGVSHIAAAVATASVVICSGADPRRWAPLDGARHRLLFQPVSCRPCMHFSCPLAGHPCADGVSTDKVWTAAGDLLSDGAARRVHARHAAPAGILRQPGVGAGHGREA